MFKPIAFLATISVLSACGGGGGSSSSTAPTQSPSSLSSVTTSLSSSLFSSSSSHSSNSSLVVNPSSSLGASLSSSSRSISSSISSSILSSSSSLRSSNSNSSSSLSSVDSCNSTSEIIFAECLNTTYGYIIGSQYSPSYIEYTTSREGEQVQWSIQDSKSTHDNVLDVVFTDNNRKGQITIGNPDSNPATIDLSQFQTGSLNFDIRVTDFGDAYDRQAGGVVFVARMDCLWPCAAHETQFVIPAVDAWTNISLPIADFIATGLDMSKISASLVLVPRGNQANLRIQLDNVQLIKGGPVITGPVNIFKEDFNKKVFPEWKITNVAGNTSTTVTTNFGFGATLNFIWQGVNNIVRFDTTLDKSIDLTNKHASFQINCWKDTEMNFSFQMVSTDVNGNTETTDANYATSLNTDTWYNVYADFGSVFSGNYDPKRINKIGVQFTYLDAGAASTICQVDTIRITE